MNTYRVCGMAGLRVCLFIGFIGAAFAQTPPRVRFVPVIYKVEPVYPVSAKRKRIKGPVRLDVVIGKNGHVTRVSAVSGNPTLVDAAKNAVLQWAYRPTLLNGEAIEVATEVCVPFALSKAAPPQCAGSPVL